VAKEYPEVLSAGGILIDDEGRVLLCHPTRSRWDNWRIPKGEVNDDEDPRRAALREVLEETGYKCKILRRLKTNVRYKSRSHGRTCRKTLRIYLMKPIAKIQEPDRENDQFLWVKPKKALEMSAFREHDLIKEAIELFAQLHAM